MTLRRWLSGTNAGAARIAQRTRLGIEVLEGRAVLSAPGTLDPSFGTDGTVALDLSTLPSEFLNATAIQSDGKIVAAGSVNYGGVAGEFAVARFNTDGSLDTSFGTGGSTITSLASLPPGYANGTTATAVAIQPDGKIVLAGYYSAGGGLFHTALVRYNADGSLDTTFGTGGIVETEVADTDQATSIAIQSDGKIVVAGTEGAAYQFQSDFDVVRYNTDGSLDTTFGTGGVVETPAPLETDAKANAVLIQPDGKIVIGGHTSTSSEGFYYSLIRYNSDGSLDSSFGTNGEVFDDLGDFTDVRGLALQSDGKIVAVGAIAAGPDTGLTDGIVARYNSDGSLDTSFNGTGWTTFNLGESNEAQGVAVQANGKIVVVGADLQPGGSYFLTLRYDTDGTLDSGFGSGGYVTQKYSSDGNDIANAVLIQPDGAIVVAGTAGAGNTDSAFALARYFGDAVLSAAGVSVAATIGSPFSGTVATFTDSDPSATADQFSATILWGDGATSTGTVTADGQGGFVVTGSHTYTSTGGPVITVEIESTGDGSTSTTAVADVTAGYITLSAGATVSATVGTPFNGTVAAFTDSDPAVTTGQFSATILWGDGTTSTGTVTADGQGGFVVTGSHAFTRLGGAVLTVSITGPGGSSASAFVVTEVTSADSMTLSSSAPQAGVGQSVTFTAQVAGGSAPSGSVTFSNATTGTFLGIAYLDATGSAQLTTSALPAGTDLIEAAYSGDSTHAAESVTYSETITRATASGRSTSLLAVGTGPGAPGYVSVYDPQSGALLGQFEPFGAYTGGVKVAVGDVNGDGYEDLIVMAGPGSLNGLVQIYSGRDFSLLSTYFAFPGYQGEFNLATGDLTGNGIDDVIFSTATGGDFVFAYAGASAQMITLFSAFGGFTGGVTIAAGDVLGDGEDQIIVGTASRLGAAGVFDLNGQLLQPYDFAPVPMDGVNVAAGDLNGSGHDDIIFGARAGSTLVLEYDGSSQDLMGWFFAYPGQSFGVNVATEDPTGDGYADILISFIAPSVQVLDYDGATDALLSGFFAEPPGELNSAQGVYVGSH